MFDDETSLPNVLLTKDGFRSGMRRLARALETSGGFDGKDVELIRSVWMNRYGQLSVLQAFEMDGSIHDTTYKKPKKKDVERRFSWGDRHFQSRPTILNGDLRLDPAMFQCASTMHKIPFFRRFEDAWIEYMFRQDPDGKLQCPMPVNPHVAQSLEFTPSILQILAYMNLFFFDWCITLFFHELQRKELIVNWYTLRDAAVREKKEEVELVHTASFMHKLLSKVDVVAIQEISPSLLTVLRDSYQSSSSELVLSEEQVQQRCGILVKGGLSFESYPMADVKGMKGRFVSILLEKETLVICVHCYPHNLKQLFQEIDLYRQFCVKEGKPLKQIILMGDFNTNYEHILSLALLCDQYHFHGTWNPLLGSPPTVNGTRTKWLQAQIQKGGVLNCAPKDHILVWRAPTMHYTHFVRAAHHKRRNGRVWSTRGTRH